MEKWLLRVDSPTPSFKLLINEVLTEFWHIATTPHLKYGFTSINKRLAPVEFVFVGKRRKRIQLFRESCAELFLWWELGVLLYILRTATHEDRARQIYHMRSHIRKQFTDIRSNAHVTRAMWSFIDTVASGSWMRGDGEDIPEGRKGKRKRKGADDDKEEYRPSPIKSFGSVPKTRSKLRE